MGKGLQKVEISFEKPGVTHYGGMLFFHRFCRKLHLRRLFQRYIAWERRESSYHGAELLLCLIYTMVAGLERISDTRILAYNRSFQKLLGFARFPADNTLRRFLKGLTPRELLGIVRVHDLLRRQMRAFPRARTSCVLDLDSTVLPVYGWQIQGARVGYNPFKPNRPSYHPLVCFEGASQDTVHGMLRPGDTHPITVAREFVQTCRSKLPRYVYRKKLALRLRADAGFFDGAFLDFLEGNGMEYVVVARMIPTLKGRARAMRFRTFRKRGGWQVAHTIFKPTTWDKGRRFVIVRRPKPQSEEEQAQLTLWEFKDYFYHAFVTDLSLKPAAVYRFYTGRANAELDIRELKRSLPLGKVPTARFTANAAHFELILLAYDLMNWFRRLCLSGSWQHARLSTLRRELFMLPARLLRVQNRNVLRLPGSYPHRKRLLKAASAIAHLRLP